MVQLLLPTLNNKSAFMILILVTHNHYFRRNRWASQVSFTVGFPTPNTAKRPALQIGWRGTDNNCYYKLSGVTSPSLDYSSQHPTKN